MIDIFGSGGAVRLDEQPSSARRGKGPIGAGSPAAELLITTR